MTPEPTALVIGTRGSQLAIWQAEHVAARLGQTRPGLAVQLAHRPPRLADLVVQNPHRIGEPLNVNSHAGLLAAVDVEQIENRLREPGALTMAGENIDLSQVKMPTYVFAAREDHIVPWKGGYASALALGLLLLGAQLDAQRHRKPLDPAARMPALKPAVIDDTRLTIAIDLAAILQCTVVDAHRPTIAPTLP